MLTMARLLPFVDNGGEPMHSAMHADIIKLKYLISAIAIKFVATKPFFQGLVTQLRGEVMEANDRLQRTVSSGRPL